MTDLSIFIWLIEGAVGLICLGAALKIYDIAKDVRKIREQLETKNEAEKPIIQSSSARR